METEINKIRPLIKFCFLKIYRNKFIRFGFVGGLGTLTNLIIFFIFVDLFKFMDIIIQITGFFIALTQNFILNSVFTFNEEITKSKTVIIRYLKYVLTCITGLIINLVVYNLILYLFNPEIKVIAQAIGIFAGLIMNFIGSKYFVFIKKVNS